jgi:O-antigen/teichoic acid export membrane protein
MTVVFCLWWLTNILVAVVACWFIWHRKCELETIADRSTENARDVNLRSVWIGGFPFFVATVVLSALQYAERFFASGVVSPDALGRYVFSWSIANAVQTIAYATIVVTAGPRLVRSIDRSDSGFRALLGRSARLTLCVTLAASAVILLAHKPIFRFAHELADIHELVILLTLLASFVLRSVADLYWSGAVALRLGKQVAISISCVAIASVPIEWLLVSRMDAMGAAIAHLTASVGILALLMVIVTRSRCPVTQQTQNGVTHAS